MFLCDGFTCFPPPSPAVACARREVSEPGLAGVQEVLGVPSVELNPSLRAVIFLVNSRVGAVLWGLHSPGSALR